MSIKPIFHVAAGMLAAASLLASAAIGQTVVNDNFDSGTFGSGWSSTAGTTITAGTGAAGSARFARLAASSATRLASRFDAVQTGGMATFTIDTQIRVQSSTTRQLQLQISTSSGAITTNAASVNLRYQNEAWGLYNGSVWQPVSGLGALTPGAWHRLRLTGRDWGQAAARFDIELSSANASTFTSSSSGLTMFHLTTATSQMARYFVFTTEFENIVGSDIDEVLAYGASGPVPPRLDLTGISTASQSATSGTSTADKALDNNPATISQTTNAAGSFWQVELDRTVTMQQLHIVPPTGSGLDGLLNGLVLKIYNLQDQLVFSQTISGTIAGQPWNLDLPGGIDARIIRLELPASGTNGVGDQRIAVADVAITAAPLSLTGTNYALNAGCYMVRLMDSLPPASYANDGSVSTMMETTTRTVDGYWETDLGQERALHHIRVVGLDAAAEQARLAHATLRLFDANHKSIYSKHLTGASSTFDMALPGPVLARYVRVGFENKERSSANGSTEWYLRILEVEAYGRPAAEAGIVSFTASDPEISTGESVTLDWQTSGVQSLRIHPAIGSVGAATTANGTGQISVTPTTTTEYMMVGTTPTATFIRHVTVRVNGQALPPRISEFAATNRLSLRDGYKSAPDWIELYNPNDSPFDLTGYCLSDNPALPAKWTFPSGAVIPPHGHLVVCASDNPQASPDAAGYWHAGFSLAAAGESVVLSTPGGAMVLDAINFAAQDEDLAYGRTPEGVWTFMEPTPGKANLAETYSGWQQPLVFSHSRGIYSSSFSLAITNPNGASQILYSLDGTEPSLVYTTPISISGSKSVRARPFRAGYHAPRTQTHSYVFPNATPTSSGMNSAYASGSYLTRQLQGFQDLPTICLSVPDLPDDYIETEGSAEFFLPGNPVPIQVNCGMERFGGAWTVFTKKSYRLNFSAEYGARKLEAPLFNGFDHGIAVKEVFDSLELRAGNHDMVARGFYMGARFIEDSTLEMGTLNPHGRFVHVYINGKYWGMYDIRERMDDAFLAEYLGGAKEDYVNVRGNDNVETTTFIPGTPEPPNRALWEDVRANRTSYAAIKDKVDMQSLIDFMLLWLYGNCENEFRCAGPIVPGSGFKFWIADPDGFLYTNATTLNAASLTLDRTSNGGPGSIFGALVTEGHPDFKTILADRIQKHFFNNGVLTPERNLARLNARMTEVQNAMVSECARWGFRSPENWVTAANAVRNGLFPQRTNNLFSYMRTRGLFPAVDAPVFSQHGGGVDAGFQLSFSPISGTVYFTTDGSDPRLPGGAASPTALTWTSTAQTLIATGSTWKYRDLGSLPAANWHTAAYNDSAWATGTAPLGYGDAGIATTVSYGTNSNAKYPTTYFRKTFNVTNPAQFSQLTLGLVRDDGAVVYLNGIEVARSNMPSGTIGYTTSASTAVGGTAETTAFTFTVPANLLVTGTNLLAVELHQHGTVGSINSSDLRFDLSLVGSASASAIALNGNTTVKARVFDGGTWSAMTEAAFQVAYPLVANGPYIFGEWPATEAAGSYPDHMVFYQTPTATPDPVLSLEMNAPWVLDYARSIRSRINGLGANGFSFINTSDPQAETGSGFVGAAVLALNTSGAQDIRVTWTGGTVTPNTRDYGIRLQYRVGDSGSFLDVADSNGNPVEYLRNASAGHSQVIGPVTLPAAANNNPLVQLRWKYYYRGGTTGARAQLRMDDIQVSAGNPAPSMLEVALAPPSGQLGTLLSPITVQARSATGALATGYSGTVELSLVGNPAPLSGTTIRNAVDGVAVFNDVIIQQAGTHTFSASAAGLVSGQADNLTRVVGLTENIVPLYVQGKALNNDQRVPHACHFSLTGLRPDSTYRYANRITIAGDPPEQDGAGNMIFIGPAGASFVRSQAAPSFLPADLNLGHGVFTSDSQGAISAWFVIEPTGNPRFTPGNIVYPLLLLNDGEDGTTVFHKLTASSPVQVMEFGTSPGHGSAVYGDTEAAAKHFVVIHESADGTTRPLAATPVESTGAGSDPLYADFYETMVAGQTGRWGTLLPNSLAAGIRRIESRDGQSGALLSVFTAPDGQRTTTLLGGGTHAIGIRVPGPAADGFAHWQARHFSLTEMTTGGIGSPNGAPAGDGISNLLKYAFGMHPFDPDRDGLPTIDIVELGGQKRLKFQYRRLTGLHGLTYEIGISNALGGWTNAEASLLPIEESAPGPSPGTENVSRYLPLQPNQPQQFLRMGIRQP